VPAHVQAAPAVSEAIMPAATVWLVASSIRMKAPVMRLSA